MYSHSLLMSDHCTTQVGLPYSVSTNGALVGTHNDHAQKSNIFVRVLTQFASVLRVSEHLAEWGSSRTTDMELEESLRRLFVTPFLNGLYRT